MARGTSTALEDLHEPDPNAVATRLTELGISPPDVAESLRIGHTLGDFTTVAHPTTYPGMVVWGEITGAFRQRMAVKGWTFDDRDCIPRTVSPDQQVVVVPVRGNDNTGIRGAHEQLSTRRPRGDAGVRIIRVNTQLVLQLEDTHREKDLVANLGGTWFLLYNRVGDVVRSELSYAKSVTASGALFQWAERLILPDIDLLGPEPRESPKDAPPAPDVDVPVSRRIA